MKFPEITASFDALELWLTTDGIAAFSNFAFDTAFGVMLTILVGSYVARAMMIMLLPNFIAGPGGMVFDTDRGRGALDLFVMERR